MDNVWQTLERACSAGDLAAVRQILDGGFEMNQERSDLCLNSVCAHCSMGPVPSFQGYVDTARLFMDLGANPNAIALGLLNDEDDTSPLLSAAIWEHVALAQLLLARGANVNYRIPQENGTALTLTCRHISYRSASEPVDIARLLLDHGADIHLADVKGRTPLHYACRAATRYAADTVGKKVRLARLLLERGAASDIYRKDNGGKTPLETFSDADRYNSDGELVEVAVRHPRMTALLRKHFAIVVRKYVIGPPAEHPHRRIEHQAPHIASYLV